MNNKKEKPDSVTYTQAFAATIKKKGRNNFLDYRSPGWMQYQINKFKVGEKVSLLVHNRKPKRTDAQNRYYWGAYLPKVAKETGESDLNKLHTLFKGKFLTIGIYEILGEKIRITKSSANLSVSGFSEFIMNIESDTGVKAPPTESYGLEPLYNSNY